MVKVNADIIIKIWGYKSEEEELRTKLRRLKWMKLLNCHPVYSTEPIDEKIIEIEKRLYEINGRYI